MKELFCPSHAALSWRMSNTEDREGINGCNARQNALAKPHIACRGSCTSPGRLGIDKRRAALSLIAELKIPGLAR